MKDLNFFEDYIEKRKFKFNKKMLISMLISIGVFCFIIYSISNQMQIRKLNYEVTKLRNIAEDPKINDRVNKIKEKETEVNRFKEEVENIRIIDDKINLADLINENLIIDISSKLPKDLFLKSISINNNTIHLLGISKDKWAIAEFSKGLETLDNLKNIYISNISKDEEHYNFNVDINLKDVMIDGESNSEEENKNETVD